MFHVKHFFLDLRLDGSAQLRSFRLLIVRCCLILYLAGRLSKNAIYCMRRIRRSSLAILIAVILFLNSPLRFYSPVYSEAKFRLFNFCCVRTTVFWGHLDGFFGWPNAEFAEKNGDTLGRRPMLPRARQSTIFFLISIFYY